MYLRIVTFGLAGIDAEQYGEIAEQVAPGIRGWPGLTAKFWLADETTNTYGGVYVFESREHADASRATEQFIGMTRNPHFADLTIREFGVLDAPTAITAPALARH